MIYDITSAKNPRLKRIKGLSQKKNREKCGEYTVEGMKSVTDAVSAGADISCIVISDSFCIEAKELENYEVLRVPDWIFDSVCDTKTPQGILAVIKLSDRGMKSIDKNGMYIYCDGVRDPGNLGTIIRTADAAAFDGVLLSPDCADLYNPKTVRATMGSMFRIGIWEDITSQELAMLADEGMAVYGGLLADGAADYRDVDYVRGFIAVVGNEANGISEAVEKLCTPIKIPIYGGAESLNAGVAAAVIMYEAANKRNKT